MNLLHLAYAAALLLGTGVCLITAARIGGRR